MNDKTKPGEFIAVVTEQVFQLDDFQVEIDIAMDTLLADRLDIQQLLSFIVAKPHSRQQIPGLVKKSYERLQTLRIRLDELALAARVQDELHHSMESLRAAIQIGHLLSLGTAEDELDQIDSKYQEYRHNAEFRAVSHEMQALIAAIQQEYAAAVNYYEKAAANKGLGAEKQRQYHMEKALLLADFGREFNDVASLESAVFLFKQVIQKYTSENQHPEDWAKTYQELGMVLGVLGQHQSGTRYLEDSIDALEVALSKRDRKQVPFLWAETQNSLGNVVGALGFRQADEALIDRAITAFELAIQETPRETSAQEWANTSNNLAAALQSKGQRTQDAKLLKRSVEGYKAVLQIWTRKKMPYHWALTMNNLGSALRVLGEYRKGPRTLEQSVAAYKSSLAEFTRKHFPGNWAMVQNNLGAALQKLAERVEDIQVLEQAVSAYEKALKEWTMDKAPKSWSMTTANLGVARRMLAEATQSPDMASQAVETLEAVSAVFRNASHAQYSELVIDQLAQARKVMDMLYRNKGKYAGFIKR